nr:MAG TPA: hypothetical protein [Caudoviricetes sp.]
MLEQKVFPYSRFNFNSFQMGNNFMKLFMRNIDRVVMVGSDDVATAHISFNRDNMINVDVTEYSGLAIGIPATIKTFL